MQAGSAIFSEEEEEKVPVKPYNRLQDIYESNLDENGQLDGETHDYLAASGFAFPASA